MGVSILMTPGPIGRNFGDQKDITPGFRSTAAATIQEVFGSTPLTLTVIDAATLKLLAMGAATYTMGANMFQQILDALDEHSAVTITLEY